MNETMKPGHEGHLQVGEELIKALVAKTIDNGSAIQESRELIRNVAESIRQLPDSRADVQTLDKRMDVLDEHVTGTGSTITEVKELVQRMTAQRIVGQEDIEGLRYQLKQHALIFQKPYHKDVHHTYFLGKPLLVLGGVALVFVTMLFFWNKTWLKAEQHAENDIKWRYIKQTHDSTVLKALNGAEDQYKMIPDQFRRDVEEEEARRQRLFEKMEQRIENENDIYELQQKEKKK